MTRGSEASGHAAAAIADRTVKVDGGEIRYSVSGRGPAVLMIQGVGVAGGGWRPQVEAIATRFTAITFDNRGIGRSRLGTSPLTVEGMAGDALAILAAEGIDGFHLVGHSMGGLIAQHVALTARARIRSLALMCTFADGKDGSRLSPSMMLLGLRTRIGTRAMRRNGMMQMIMPASYLRTVDRRRLGEELQALFGRDLADQPPIVMTQLRAMSRYDASTRLPELSGIPTLVISAAHDPIAPPRLGRALAAAIGSARFVEFEDAGHAVPIQCAREVNALLIDHLSGASTTR